MRLIYIFVILLYHLSLSQSSLYTNLKDSLPSYLKPSLEDIRKSLKNNVGKSHHLKRSTARDDVPKLLKIIKNEEILSRHRGDNKFPKIGHLQLTTERYRMDPVLNFVRRNGNHRRAGSDTSDSSSSSLELENWKDEWRQHWVMKKLEAINASKDHANKGDVVNMVAARPWGVPCGDPGKHDMPWGSCMLPMECEPEYRIFRGDYFCGRTSFVCCAIQLTNYDLNQGFDVSFADSELSTSSEERKGRDKGSKESKKRKRRKDKRRRKRERAKRKKKIRKHIRKIIREMRKILNRSYRNGTTERKKRTKHLKEFVKDLKKKYKAHRKLVTVIHEHDLIKIDDNLMKKLNEIRDANANFVKNETFRQIVMKGMLDKRGARMLLEAYPELSSHLRTARRSGQDVRPDYLDYDIEYGMLYY